MWWGSAGVMALFWIRFSCTVQKDTEYCSRFTSGATTPKQVQWRRLEHSSLVDYVHDLLLPMVANHMHHVVPYWTAVHSQQEGNCWWYLPERCRQHDGVTVEPSLPMIPNLTPSQCCQWCGSDDMVNWKVISLPYSQGIHLNWVEDRQIELPRNRTVGLYVEDIHEDLKTISS